MNDAADTAARAAALDPTRSFIVQAPAGSGKTELLIQRYLALLATVEEPEQVVAITFTRKAAAEMRRRVLEALRAAAAGEAGATPHRQATLRLARAVREHDAARDWALLEQPLRLRIDTLDAFNVWLARQLPVLSGGVAAAQIVDDARDRYRRAAQRTVACASDAGEPGESLRALLREIDDVAALEELLARLLARREQWLLRFATAEPAELKPVLEGALRRLVDDELAGLAPLAGPPLWGELRAVLRHVAARATDDRLRDACGPWRLVDDAPPAAHDALAAWRGAAMLLLTQKGTWRQRLDKKQGFGPEHAEPRRRLDRLLAQLRTQEPLRAALHAAQTLPEPRYTERQWQHLSALRTVLLHLAGELRVIFGEERSIDFVELGLAARQALGAVDRPSDLLLALDRRIQHFLVDEFQDTSQSQLRLLETLTAGWERGDGRTLFLVGDPMQSIYRFRDADMSLFLDAKRRGVGGVALETLVLRRNFRARPRLVEWVNETFSKVFPEDDRIAAGVAGFSPSAAAREAGGGQLVATHCLRSRDPRAEATKAVEILRGELERAPEQSIAVLVRSRSHLVGLREQLRARGLAVRAIEIDALAEQPVAQDLLALTRALLHLDDRIAWLAILRAPWCGLAWRELHALCHDARDGAVWDLAHDARIVSRLGADARRRLAATRATLESALARRAGTSLARWVERTWVELGGPACADHADDVRAAEQFFALLAREERHGDLDDPVRLADSLGDVLLQGDPPRGRGIEIMTMHRAKGLEFDTVIALGLGRDPPPDDPKALYWHERVAADGSEDLLLAPSLEDADSMRLADFVHEADRERDRAERARLLYVATTRARERLHVICQLSPAKKAPAAGALLEILWPFVGPELEALVADDVGEAPSDDAVTPVLRRLVPAAAAKADDATQIALPFGNGEPIEHSSAARPEFAWASPAAAHVGTVVHRHLQAIAELGADAWSARAVEKRAPELAAELRLLGVEDDELEAATARVVAALRGALEDPVGRWVLSRHEDARSELRLTLRSGDVLEHVRLDRTFVADGRRWIIDFKTGRHEGADRDAFLASEVERYRPQLDRYAAALAAIESRPVQVGLYFPLLKTLEAWPAGGRSG